MDVGRKHETPGSEAKDFITHSNSSSSCVSNVLCQFPKSCSQGWCGEDQVALATHSGLHCCMYLDIHIFYNGQRAHFLHLQIKPLSLSQGCPANPLLALEGGYYLYLQRLFTTQTPLKTSENRGSCASVLFKRSMENCLQKVGFHSWWCFGLINKDQKQQMAENSNKSSIYRVLLSRGG